MSAFPLLKTGAVAQYPLQRTIGFQTQAVRFLNGSQQKYRIYGAGLRRWAVALEVLDEAELAAVITWVEEQTGAPFAFMDPVTGESVPRCVIGDDAFEAGTTGELHNTSRLTIQEIP